MLPVDDMTICTFLEVGINHPILLIFQSIDFYQSVTTTGTHNYPLSTN